MIAGTELLEALPVAVYTTDAEGRITFYNDAAAELWGQAFMPPPPRNSSSQRM
jgi:PAS domain-containing protein